MMFSLLRLVAVSALLTLFASAQDGRTSELILRNGAIYIMDASRSWAEAVAIADGRILFAARIRSCQTGRTIDEDHRSARPHDSSASTDSHTHLMEGGVGMSLCNLKDLKTPQDELAEIRKFAAGHPDRLW